jgi:hypothetical protein
VNAVKKNTPILGEGKNRNEFRRCDRRAKSGPCSECSECSEKPIPFKPLQPLFFKGGLQKKQASFNADGFSLHSLHPLHSGAPKTVKYNRTGHTLGERINQREACPRSGGRNKEG